MNMSSNGNVIPNKAEIAMKIAPLIGMKVMLNSDKGVSVTTVKSIKVTSTGESPLVVVLYTDIGLVTVDENRKLMEILVINPKGNAETLYSIISDVVYF